MRARIPFTVSELMALREEGLSNHDIAAKLDISEQTVRNYIGAQHKQLPRLAAFADSEPHRTEECPTLDRPIRRRLCGRISRLLMGLKARLLFIRRVRSSALKLPQARPH